MVSVVLAGASAVSTATTPAGAINGVRENFDALATAGEKHIEKKKSRINQIPIRPLLCFTIML
jgi:hypothetical protein